MKKILSTFAFALLLAGSAFAQTTFSANATVVEALTIAEARATDFANLPADFSTAPVAIDPTDGTGTGNVSGTQVTGLISVDGANGATVDVVFDASFTLNGPGAETLTFAPSLATTDADASTNPTTAAALAGGSFTLDAGDGSSTIVVGGSLTASATPLTVGAYSGTGSITVSYQ